jgi:hypothetical protein
MRLLHLPQAASVLLQLAGELHSGFAIWIGGQTIVLAARKR